jgi:hypothetical protein
VTRQAAKTTFLPPVARAMSEKAPQAAFSIDQGG